VQAGSLGTYAPFPRLPPGPNHEDIRDLFLPLGIHCSWLHVMSRVLTIIKPHLPASIPSSTTRFISLWSVFSDFQEPFDKLLVVGVFYWPLLLRYGVSHVLHGYLMNSTTAKRWSRRFSP